MFGEKQTPSIAFQIRLLIFWFFNKKKGIIYFLGRDKQMRPIMVSDFAKSLEYKVFLKAD